MLCTNMRSILSVRSFLNDPSICSRATARSSFGRHALGGEEELVTCAEVGQDLPEGFLRPSVAVRRVDDLAAHLRHAGDHGLQSRQLLGRVLATVHVGAEPDDGHAFPRRRDRLGDERALRAEPCAEGQRPKGGTCTGHRGQPDGVASSESVIGVCHVSGLQGKGNLLSTTSQRRRTFHWVDAPGDRAARRRRAHDTMPPHQEAGRKQQRRCEPDDRPDGLDDRPAEVTGVQAVLSTRRSRRPRCGSRRAGVPPAGSGVLVHEHPRQRAGRGRHGRAMNTV